MWFLEEDAGWPREQWVLNGAWIPHSKGKYTVSSKARKMAIQTIQYTYTQKAAGLSNTQGYLT